MQFVPQRGQLRGEGLGVLRETHVLSCFRYRGPDGVRRDRTPRRPGFMVHSRVAVVPGGIGLYRTGRTPFLPARTLARPRSSGASRGTPAAGAALPVGAPPRVT
ncbi:hypothetical protein GCM10027079_22380 [Sediminivirga luteola]|uniref:Uncharacterized protein n=1 Tax=Sediminivirga luteola TaxID=1774748 RepID=A0A8J2TW96_9MICO|nr:hypothetical protein GCM10011333_07220 [Sediminivirga luteola]